MLTPEPFDLGLIIMGNSQVAFDAVCCAIIGVDPRTVDHIRFAAERGFGTTDLAADRHHAATCRSRRRRSAPRASKSGSSASRSTSRARTSRPTPGRRRRTSTPTTAGAVARAPSRRRSRSFARSTRMRHEHAALHVVFGAYDGPDRRETRREGRLHRRLRAVEG